MNEKQTEWQGSKETYILYIRTHQRNRGAAQSNEKNLNMKREGIELGPIKETLNKRSQRAGRTKKKKERKITTPHQNEQAAPAK